tara:strand:- start:156 stop:1004 length:849 start_codon:yes stop_codon:yes gene_type:complete
MHYYQFNVGDYIKTTFHLTLIEDAVYRRLLDFYYDTEKPLPNDNQWLIRKLKLQEAGEEVLTIILNEFFILTDNGWLNKRADEEIKGYKIYLDKQKANGIKGGRPKNPPITQRITQAEPKITLNTNHKPLNTKQIDTPTAKAPKGVKVLLDLKALLTLVPDLPTEVAETFLDVRKRLRAPLTKLALTHLENEAKKANLGTVEAITMAAANSWRGFKADWVKTSSGLLATDKPWFLTLDGIDAKAKALGIEQGADQYQVFRSKVLTLAGVKPDEYKEAKKKFS